MVGCAYQGDRGAQRKLSGKTGLEYNEHLLKRGQLLTMQFDTNNPVVKLCALGMRLEGEGNPEEAHKIFQQAWNESVDDFDKLTSAHYVARHQKTIAEKLEWDEIALNLALKIDDDRVKMGYPSLYLNIGKCYEDLNEFDNARKNYQLALSFIDLLPDNSYASIVKQGIANGLARIAQEN
jgi:tetratricopeptide (TPR) repeat protein